MSNPKTNVSPARHRRPSHPLLGKYFWSDDRTQPLPEGTVVAYVGTIDGEKLYLCRGTWDQRVLPLKFLTTCRLYDSEDASIDAFELRELCHQHEERRRAEQASLVMRREPFRSRRDDLSNN